jgi:hypothetical protein
MNMCIDQAWKDDARLGRRLRSSVRTQTVRTSTATERDDAAGIHRDPPVANRRRSNGQDPLRAMNDQ